MSCYRKPRASKRASGQGKCNDLGDNKYRHWHIEGDTESDTLAPVDMIKHEAGGALGGIKGYVVNADRSPGKQLAITKICSKLNARFACSGPISASARYTIAFASTSAHRESRLSAFHRSKRSCWNRSGCSLRQRPCIMLSENTGTYCDNVQAKYHLPVGGAECANSGKCPQLGKGFTVCRPQKSPKG